MIGIIVKNGSIVVDKQVFFGDDVKTQALIDSYKSKNPTLTVEVHRDTDPDEKTAFEQVNVDPVVNPDKSNWQTAKAGGVPSALTFIAKKLGLE